MTAYGAPCRWRSIAPVTLIDHSGERVRLETSQGTLSPAR